MKAPVYIVIAGLWLTLGCDGTKVVSDIETPTSCDSAGDCSACSSCFDTCRCGGGTAKRCAESCTETTTSGGDAGSGDAGRMSTPYVGTFVAEEFDIPPNGEFFRCQNFANPFGKDIAILDSSSFMTAGAHHMFAFETAGIVDGPLEECGGLSFEAYVHSTQRSQEHITYPPGVGRLLSAGEGVRLNIHYLNVSSTTVHAEVAVTLRGTDPSAVPKLASYIFANTISLSVEPHSKGSSVHSCMVGKDIDVFETSSHMHSHGVYFSARGTDGQLLYETNQWAEPNPWVFTPARHLKAGTTIDVRCDYQNDTDGYLSFGESAATNEMCIFTGAYYPADRGESITCLF